MLGEAVESCQACRPRATRPTLRKRLPYGVSGPRRPVGERYGRIERKSAISTALLRPPRQRRRFYRGRPRSLLCPPGVLPYSRKIASVSSTKPGNREEENFSPWAMVLPGFS